MLTLADPCSNRVDRGNPAWSWLYIRAHLAWPNRYPARCITCGTYLEAGQGAVQWSTESRRYVYFC